MNRLLDALREQTTEAHRQLHIHPFMTQRVLSDLTPRSYASFLSAFAVPWARLDPLQSRCFDGVGPLPSLWPALCQDLEALGEPPTHTHSIGVEAPAALGLAYVLYGSSQGAPVLARRMGHQLPTAPMAYLTSADGAHGWQTLLPVLAGAPGQGAVADAAIASARAVFEEIDQAWTAALESG